MTELEFLVRRQGELRTQLREVERQIDTHRVRCPTCRCRILPGTECTCCASSALDLDEMDD